MPEARSASVAARRPGRPPLRYLLHLGTLWSLAVAQPLLDLLGRNAEFFAIRRSAPEDIVLFAVGLVVLPPLALFAVEALAGLADARLRRATHLAWVAALVALIALAVLKRGGGSSAVLIPLSVIVGAGAALLYARAEVARSFLTVLAPAPLIVVLLFLFGTPVNKLVTGAEAKVRLAGDGGRAPVVIVVLDELSVTSLLGADGRVDGRRYPGFAALARDAYWFRNTASVDAQTAVAVPAILTARRPASDRLPTADDHPRSLFTLLGRDRQMHVHEAVTQLCPEQLCHERRTGFGERMRSLVSDLSVVSLHVALPDDLRRRLPSIDTTWQGFLGQDGDGERAGKQDPGAFFLEQFEKRRADADRLSVAGGFVGGLPRRRQEGRGALSFMHILLPHIPWEFLPNGKRYGNTQRVLGLTEDRWGSDRGATAVALQRYLLQVGLVDRVVGALVRRLRSIGAYDESLIVVTADHGVSFRPGQPRRQVTRQNAVDILPVPLFVKAPGQRRGRVVDTHLQTVDILPTLASLLKVRVPWRTEGRSAFDRGADRRTVTITNGGRDPLEIDSRKLDGLRAAALRQQLALVGAGGFPRLGGDAARALVGRPVPALVAAPDGASATLDNPVAFASVDRAGPFVPVHVSGKVRGTEAREVVVAVNGRIRAVTPLVREGDDRAFSTVIPDSALREGANRVEVMAMTGGVAATRLVPLVRTGGEAASYALEDGSIVGPGGKRFPIVPGRVRGGVDTSIRDDRIVRLSGWALGAGRSGPVDQILGFEGRRLLFYGPPSGPRDGIAQIYHVPADNLAFRFDVPESNLSGRPALFALRGGVASPLEWFCENVRQEVGC